MKKIEVADDDKKSERKAKGKDPDKESSRQKKASKSAKAPAKRKPAIKSLQEIVCPECGKGHISLKRKTAYGCSEFRNGCTSASPFETYAHDLTPAKLAAQIKRNQKSNKADS